MKILLTLDLDQPASPERVHSENLFRFIWDQLQVTGISVDAFSGPAPSHTVATWPTQPSSLKKYLQNTPSPLSSYDLVIGINLPPGAEALFNSLKIKTLLIRPVPCSAFARIVLARANFPLPEEFLFSLPQLNNVCYQNFLGKGKLESDRVWWLANRFLLNRGKKDSSILFLGTSVLQPERLHRGSLVNLITYTDTVMELLRSCPNFYYASPLPMDHSELRFMKHLGATCPSLSLTQLLARDEFNLLVSLDSAFVPVAEAFNKKIIILGTQPTWSTIQARKFCDESFMLHLFQAPLQQS